MRRKILTSLLVGAALLVGGELRAQQPAPPPPPSLDAIPDKMPFNTPYGAPITADRANSLIAAVDSLKRQKVLT